MNVQDADNNKAVKDYLIRWRDSNNLTPKLLSEITPNSLSTCKRWFLYDNESRPDALDLYLVMIHLGEHRVCLEPCCELCCALKEHPQDVYDGLLSAFGPTQNQACNAQREEIQS